MSPLPSWLQSPPPSLAIDIDARRVTAVVARPGSMRVEAHASMALPSGAVVPSLTVPNIQQAEVVAGAVRQVVEQIGGRHRRCALVIPDTAAKVTLLRFEQVPEQARDLDQLIRLQLKKALPFPVDQAQVSIVEGRADGEGREFVVVAARRDVIAGYEHVCTSAGLHAGTVDISTVNVLNAVLLADAARGRQPHDWLLVRVGAEYSSFAIVRDGHVIFFRTRPTDAEENLADVVHQTRMYFEDRLAGEGFDRVLLAGGSDSSDTAVLARELESRLGVAVQAVDVRQAATLTDRIGETSDVLATLAAPVGVVLRER